MESEDNICFSYSDDEKEADQPEKPLQDCNQLGKQWTFSQQKEIVLMYLLFVFYRKPLQSLATLYGCKIKLLINAYVLGCQSKDMQQLNKCKIAVIQYINKIKYVSMTAKDKHRFLGSPYVHSLAASRGACITQFGGEVFLVGNQVSEKDLTLLSGTLTRTVMIFGVKFASLRIKQRLFSEIGKYLTMVISHNLQDFKTNNIVVEVNRYCTCVNIIGDQQRCLMLGKNRMKNTIESLVCLVIKHTSLNEKNVARLQTAKISDSPIYFSQFAPDSLVIISKDNVLRKFVLHPKFMEMMGITKDTEMGIYLLGTPTRLAKRENMLTVCQQFGYDIYFINYVQYLRKVFVEEEDNIEKRQQLLKVVSSIIDGMANAKDKFDELLHKVKIDRQNKDELQNSPLDFIIVGVKSDEPELSKVLKRDVFQEKVLMKKKLLVDYKIVDREETGPIYWRFEDVNREEIPTEQLTPGRFIRGKRKVTMQGKKVYLIDSIITVL